MFGRFPTSNWTNVFWLGLTFHLCQTLLAQDQLLPVFHFQHLSTANGLSTNEIRSTVVRDGKGFIWIGALNGLERYDAYGFKNYHNIPDDPCSVSSNVIWSLLVDSKQRLWVETFATGLSLYDPNRDRFLNFLPRPGDSSWYEGKPVCAILEDHSGNIWLGTETGGVVLFEIPPNGGPTHRGLSSLDSLVRGVRTRTYSLGTPRNTAYDLLELENGKILVASDRGLIVINPTTHTLSRQHLFDPLEHRLDSISVRCIAQDTRETLWLGTATEGLFRVDLKSGRVLNYRHNGGDSLSIRSDEIWDIVADQRENLWLATLEGIDLFSPFAERCTSYLTSGRSPHGSQGKNLISIDSTGTLWVSTDNDGVYLLSPKSLRLPHYSLRDLGGSSMGFETIGREHDGKLWLSSNSIALVKE